MLNREQALDEARKQKAALETIGSWRRGLFIAAATFLVLAVLWLRQSGVLFGLGVGAAVCAALSCIAMFAVNLSIRNGHRNVERILASLQSKEIQERSATL